MIEGFFTKKETSSLTRPDGRTYSCVSCGLYKKVESPRMKPFGNFKKGILNIGEAPGKVEDANGKPFQGKTGQLLQRTYKHLGVDLFEDCLNLNACHCRPLDEDGENRTPTNYEIECCRRATFKIIEECKPKIIILLGNSAIYSLLGHRYKKELGGISKWRGYTIPDQDLGAWVCPTFHPSYVERSEDGPEETIWKQDLKQAFQKSLEPFPHLTEPTIDIIEDLSVLNKIEGEVAIDYETTGKKPHAPGHRIVCCAVADSVDHAYVFMMPHSRQERKPFIDLLANPKIGKIAQHMKFEEMWSVVRLKQNVQNWVWDTILATHILDNRPGVTGLKFQVYTQFGVVDYSSDVEPYLHSTDDTNANALNKIMELIKSTQGKERLLKYCALDAVYEYRLSKLQREIIIPL
jgi:DNA polymerase